MKHLHVQSLSILDLPSSSYLIISIIYQIRIPSGSVAGGVDLMRKKEATSGEGWRERVVMEMMNDDDDDDDDNDYTDDDDDDDVITME